MLRCSWAVGASFLLAPGLVWGQNTDPPEPVAPAPSTEPEEKGAGDAPASSAVPSRAAPSSADPTGPAGTRPPSAEEVGRAPGSAAGISEEAREAQREVGIFVEDAMLVPVPPPEPQNILADWKTALTYVRTRSTDYRQAQAQIEVARGQSRMALANSLPLLTGTGNVASHMIRGQGFNFRTQRQEAIPNPRTTWDIGATLRVPLLSARNWYDYATSRDQIEQRELQLEDAERLIIGGLAEAIVTVITTERLAEVTRVNLAAALSNLELNRRRARLGSGNAVDVLRAEQEVTNSRSQVIDADESLRRAREALGLALGYPEAWGVTPDIKMDQLRADARNTCTRNDSVDDRADIRAAAAGAAIAERNVDSVWYAFLPLVDLTSTLTYSSATTFANGKPTTWIVGGQLTWHLYDGGRRYGERRTNLALLEQSRAQLEQAQRDAQIEVIRAVRGVDVAKQSLDVAVESRRIASDNARLARSKFMNGTGTSFDMVDTQRTARQTKIDVTVKEFELLRAEIIAFLALASCEI